MNKKLAVAFGVAIVVAVVIGAGRLATRPVTDEGRYRELHRFGAVYKAAWTGKPGLLEQVAAVLHFTSLTNYYRVRLEADSKALLASGYFVRTSVPIPNLQAKLSHVRAVLSETAKATGAYYEAVLYWPSNEVRLVCRKEDVSVWKQALGRACE
jgi:hypothetical protein